MIESAADFNATLDELAHTLGRMTPERALDVLAGLLMRANEERWNREQAPRLLDVPAGPTLCFPEFGIHYRTIDGLTFVERIGAEMTIMARDGRE